jgi:hypothetical protein
LLANGWWFSPASSTTKTGRYEIAEILLKVALNTKNQNQNQHLEYLEYFSYLKHLDYLEHLGYLEHFSYLEHLVFF